ncbi:hypothetical protein EJB05_01836 [Eragrostis curvula]|uniref:U1-type domain-containing protein n=1 Tax=Eragrostis curvula TaxID=38414 RepID=A0A5J9WT59_9POAL|nr:hypothetical protein EJB05_01836 [Eragrostis curvula]
MGQDGKGKGAEGERASEAAVSPLPDSGEKRGRLLPEFAEELRKEHPVCCTFKGSRSGSHSWSRNKQPLNPSLPPSLPPSPTQEPPVSTPRARLHRRRPRVRAPSGDPPVGVPPHPLRRHHPPLSRRPPVLLPKAVRGELSKMSGNPVGVDNTSRRKFDKEEYLERARQRERQEKEDARKGKDRGPPVQRQPLKHRDYEVDLESRLGKTQVVTPIAPLSQQAGYYCSVCECVVKDSANYLDHINGKKHQRALGMSMRVERASLEQVQKRFEALKKRKDPSTFSEQGDREHTIFSSKVIPFTFFNVPDLDERIMKQQQEEEERKRQRKEKKKEKKKELAAQHEPEDVDPDIAAMMGFGGFGSSKK